jgi:ferric-dicitrate binding protein FerR (iron transport regulator)
MTDKELIDAFLSGELDEAGMAQLETELRANPDLVRELAEQQQIEQALKVLLGDDAADQQVTVSVLSVLRADPLDSWKKDLLAEVKEEAALRRREEAAAKVPQLPPAPAPAPVEAKPAIELVPPPRAARRRVLPWIAAGLAAAAALVGLGVALFSGPPAAPAVDSHAFLLSVGTKARVRRGEMLLPARTDMVLEPGDHLTIDDSSDAKIGFADDPTRINLKGPAVFHFIQGGTAKRVELQKGVGEMVVPPQTQPFTAITPHAVLSLEQGDVRLLSAADFTRAEMRRGIATFMGKRDKKSVTVEPDHYALAGKDVETLAKAMGAASPSADGPGVVAILRRVQGDVFLYSQSPADRTPARSGQPILENQSILTEGSRSSLVIDYPDHTRLEVGGDSVVASLTDRKDRTRKVVTLGQGLLNADVSKQPPGKSMILRTPQAEVGVLGTRFQLAADKEATRLQVEEGAVRFTRTEDKKSIEVRSGFFAVAAPGKPLDPAPLPGGIRYLDIDLGTGVTSGEGEWTVEGRTVKQSKVARQAEGGLSTLLCKAEADEKDSMVLEIVAEVEQTTPDTGVERGTWGFGLEAMFRNRSVVLRSAQGPEGTSVFEFPGITAIPFEHGREGVYRLKLSIARRTDSGGRLLPEAVLRGKIWQGDREPDGWMIENAFELEGPMTQVGLQTVRCACTFSSFKVKVLKEESR